MKAAGAQSGEVVAVQLGGERFRVRLEDLLVALLVVALKARRGGAR